MIMFSKEATVGEIYGPAMEIEDQREADAYFEDIVRHIMKWGKERAEAEDIARGNLGYFAGYYNDGETRARVQRLFGGVHPIFGSVPAAVGLAEKQRQEQEESSVDLTRFEFLDE